MKANGRRISALTAYDHLWATLLDEAGIDLILVGDSVATVVQGEDTTVPVTMDQMVYHASLVSRGAQRALVVGDMPFLSYRISTEQALQNAGRLMQEARVEAIKLEGGQPVLDSVRRLTDAGIPVMGHLGLTPQSIHNFGTYRVRGAVEDEATQIIEDAICLEQAGAFGIVLEKIPRAVASRVTAAISIPTIGIGAGVGCDGQILVTHDMLGLFTKFRPRFVRRYRELAEDISESLESYVRDVQAGDFPNEEESY